MHMHITFDLVLQSCKSGDRRDKISFRAGREVEHITRQLVLKGDDMVPPRPFALAVGQLLRRVGKRLLLKLPCLSGSQEQGNLRANGEEGSLIMPRKKCTTTALTPLQQAPGPTPPQHKTRLQVPTPCEHANKAPKHAGCAPAAPLTARRL